LTPDPFFKLQILTIASAFAIQEVCPLSNNQTMDDNLIKILQRVTNFLEELTQLQTSTTADKMKQLEEENSKLKSFLDRSMNELAIEKSKTHTCEKEKSQELAKMTAEAAETEHEILLLNESNEKLRDILALTKKETQTLEEKLNRCSFEETMSREFTWFRNDLKNCTIQLENCTNNLMLCNTDLTNATDNLNKCKDKLIEIENDDREAVERADECSINNLKLKNQVTKYRRLYRNCLKHCKPQPED